MDRDLETNRLISQESVHYSSIPCQHYVATEDTISGMRQNGRMSVVRRFFCLFVTFDLLFTSLLWLICLVLAGDFNIYDAFESQIVHYHIKTSLFDIVAYAMLRFILLLFFYALCHLDHWFVVALSTATTSIFLVAKVYLYEWSKVNEPVMQVLLILNSFIICWVEAWFLDLRVIPQERLSSIYSNNTLNINGGTTQVSKSLNINTLDATSDNFSNFYSPAESSDDPVSDVENSRIKNRTCRTGEKILEEAWATIHNDKWILEKKSTNGDCIFTQKLSNDGPRIYRLIGTVDLSAEKLFDILYTKIIEIPLWNPTLALSKVLQIIDSNTDICYQVSRSSGLISSRDFVLLRHWRKVNSDIVIASASTDLCSCPPSNMNYIRGKNGACCWIISKLSKNKCEVKWLLNTDIVICIPNLALKSVLISAMTDLMINLRKFSNEV